MQMQLRNHQEKTSVRSVLPGLKSGSTFAQPSLNLVSLIGSGNKVRFPVVKFWGFYPISQTRLRDN